jgi:hypothetical protein
VEKLRTIHKATHSRRFHPHGVDHVDKIDESMGNRAALPVKLLMVTGQPTSSRYPRAHHFNILF